MNPRMSVPASPLRIGFAGCGDVLSAYLAVAARLRERGLVEVAARSGRHLVCAPFTVLSPTFRAIGHRLQRGDIGKIASARGRYGWAGPDWNDWFCCPGAGAVFDLGVYNLTTLTGWFGPVERVTAMTGVTIPLAILLLGEKIAVREGIGIVLALLAVVGLCWEEPSGGSASR